jgi:hypothetical protein
VRRTTENAGESYRLEIWKWLMLRELLDFLIFEIGSRDLLALALCHGWRGGRLQAVPGVESGG